MVALAAGDTVVMPAQQQLCAVGTGGGRRHDHPHDRIGRAAAGGAERYRAASLNGVIVQQGRCGG
jgi:hypothetical protein